MAEIDWAEDHQDARVLEARSDVGVRRICEGVADVGQVHALIADQAGEKAEVIVGIETERGLLVARWSPSATSCMPCMRPTPAGRVALP